MSADDRDDQPGRGTHPGPVGAGGAPVIGGEPVDASFEHGLPGQFNVIKRNGALVPFDDEKIRIAVVKAFVNTETAPSLSSQYVNTLSYQITQSVVDVFKKRMPSGGSIHIEDIQDQVELALMRGAHHRVARAYVLYREEHRKMREQQGTPGETEKSIRLKDGTRVGLSKIRQQYLRAATEKACASFDDVDVETIVRAAYDNLYDGISPQEIQTALVIAARALIEREPNYSYVTAQLLLQQLRSETCAYFSLDSGAEPGQLHRQLFERYIQKGIEVELLDPQLAERFDLETLAKTLAPERDLQFSYLGLQTLYDRYFLHVDSQRIEWPQTFFMRVAMGLAIMEEKPTERAIQFYNTLSAFDYMVSTPTLFNSGTRYPQLSSCYLTTVPDDLDGIYSALHDNAMLSKWSGGLGNDWTQVRALGSHIKGTNGKSQGVVPFLKVVNDTAVAVNQGGKRKGATCSYLESWHLDVEEFLELRKNTGDDRRRTHDMHTANWVPDLFMKRVLADAQWTLFSPNETPDLHDLYGAEFERRYQEYEEQAKRGEVRTFKTVSASDLWRKMVSMLFETGHPWLTFKDPCNIRSPQKHRGVVHSSNLCTEITLNTEAGKEIAVCNLGSINLVQHVGSDGQLALDKLQDTVRTAVRMLDNVIDINYYPVPTARNSNTRHRPVGLGLMGFQDALYVLGHSYNSEAAVEFADRSMEAVSYYAISASAELAKERGRYESYDGSLWSQGILPIDSLKMLGEERGTEYLDVDTSSALDWEPVRALVKEHGLRNSNIMAIAPTATISNIVGVTASIEPTYANLYTKSNLSGEFTIINPYLVRALKEHQLWDSAMANDIKCYDGSLSPIERVPEELRALFATAFEVEPRFIVGAAARRQKWIDQSQSLNIYVAHTDGARLSILYQLAWQSGLKTTYYLRSRAATSTEMSSITHNTLNSIQATPRPVGTANGQAAVNGAGSNARPAVGGMEVQVDSPKACAIEDPDCEACQ